MHTRRVPFHQRHPSRYRHQKRVRTARHRNEHLAAMQLATRQAQLADSECCAASPATQAERSVPHSIPVRDDLPAAASRQMRPGSVAPGPGWHQVPLSTRTTLARQGRSRRDLRQPAVRSSPSRTSAATRRDQSPARHNRKARMRRRSPVRGATPAALSRIIRRLSLRSSVMRFLHRSSNRHPGRKDLQHRTRDPRPAAKYPRSHSRARNYER